MSLLLLVPGLVSLYLVLRGRIEADFLSVYLPCLLLLPEDYSVRISHLPPFSAAEFALMPLGVVGLSRFMRTRSLAFMDVLVVLYVASVGLSEILHEPIRTNGIFSAISAFVTMVSAYMVGRRLIEPDLRLATVKRFVVLVLLAFPSGLYEWRMGQSPYGIFGVRVLGLDTVSEVVQRRNGHGRMGYVLGGSEPAGITFAMTYCLNAWLVYLRKIKVKVNLGKTFTMLEKWHAPGLLLLLSIWLTEARGPLIALAAGVLILQIPRLNRFKNAKLKTFVLAVLLVGGYMASTAYFTAYTNVANPRNVSNEEQGSALYRRVMRKAYAPIAEAGGWTGWSLMGVPHVPGMKSIDDHYLLIHLAWGRLAYVFFLLIVWENIRVLVVRLWQFRTLQDRAFVLSMLAAMAVLWITLLTVYLGGQLPQISFLLIGWIQSMVPEKAVKSSETRIAEARSPKPSFRHALG